MNRSSERIPAHIEVEVICKMSDALVTGMIQNISETGLFLAYTGTLPAQDEMVTFVVKNTPNGQVIVGHGSVRWAKNGEEPGFGIQFKHLSSDNHKSLKAMFEQCKKSSQAS